MVKYLGVRVPNYKVGWAIRRRVLRRGPAIPEWHIFKGDVVQVLHGRDAGKQGVVRFAIPHWKKIVIEGLNIVRKNLRPSPERPMGIVNILARTRFEEVALVDPLTRKPCTVVMKDITDPKTGEMKRVRVSKESGAILERAPAENPIVKDNNCDTDPDEASKVTFTSESLKSPFPADCFV